MEIKNLMVTGGCGFIGSNFIRHLLAKEDFTGRIVNVDALTYAGNPENLAVARTVTFGTLAYAQLAFALGCRSDRYALPRLGLLSNPWLLAAIAFSGLLQLAALTIPALRPIFQVSGVGGPAWLLIAGLAIAPLIVVEAAKLAANLVPPERNRHERAR